MSAAKAARHGADHPGYVLSVTLFKYVIGQQLEGNLDGLIVSR